MKLRLPIDIQSRLDDDFAWRVREIAHLKYTARNAALQRKSAAVRATLPLLYAHWEGFVKFAAEAMLNYVLHQRHSFSELKPQFAAHGMKRQLALLTDSRKHAMRAEAVSFILSKSSNRASFDWRAAISTESNLSSAVFENIAAAIALPTTHYEPRYNFIDLTLLDRRNRIAHGEWIDLKTDGLITIADDVIGLMRKFKTDIETAVSAKSYLL